MRIRQRSRMFFVGMLALIGAATQVSAVPLIDLLWDPRVGIQQGDYLFDNFSLGVTGVGTFIPHPQAIDVYSITLGNDYGIRFAGLMAALSNRTPNSWVTLRIGYDVTVLSDPCWGVEDITLGFNGAATAGDGRAKVDEVVKKTPTGEVTATAHLDTSNPPISLNDHEWLANRQVLAKLRVDTTITLDGGKSGTATISFINQTFGQSHPEPATVGLFALALPVVLRRSRRR